MANAFARDDRKTKVHLYLSVCVEFAIHYVADTFLLLQAKYHSRHTCTANHMQKFRLSEMPDSTTQNFCNGKMFQYLFTGRVNSIFPAFTITVSIKHILNYYSIINTVPYILYNGLTLYFFFLSTSFFPLI